jgi:hypothetical protein
MHDMLEGLGMLVKKANVAHVLTFYTTGAMRQN